MKWIVPALLGLTLAVPAAAQRDNPDRVEPPTLTVSGTGDVRVAPDEATVRLGVTRQASNAQSAQEEVNRVANAIINAIQQAGVERENIQTGQLNLFPIYAQQKPGSDDEPRVVAYRASNIVRVRLSRLNLVGPVIDAGLRAGANQLEGVEFGLRNDEAARAEALRRAVAEARQKAATLAQALEVRLVSIRQVQEGGVGVFPPPMLREAAFARGGAADSTPVLPGQVTVNASVTVTYRIANR